MAFIAIRVADARDAGARDNDLRRGDAGDPNGRRCGSGHDDPGHARTDHGGKRCARRAAGAIDLAVERRDKSWRPDEQQRRESL